MTNVLFIKIWKKDNIKRFALCVNLGYRIVYLSFDKYVIAEILNKPVSALYELEEGVTELCNF